MKIKKNTVLCMVMAFVLLVGSMTVFAASFFMGSKEPTNDMGEIAEKTPDYPINENGQTYGAYPYGATVEPDLVLADGENGVTGYIKASDLGSSASSPEEAIASQDAVKDVGYKSIPLYEADGKTVIGEFRLYYSDPEC